MTPKLTKNGSPNNNSLTPAVWDADLILHFMETPAFDNFAEWMDGELADLEARWKHVSSPNALRPQRRSLLPGSAS